MFSCILTCSHGVRTRENAREHARIKGQKSVGPPSSLPPPASSSKANSAMRKRVQNHVRDFVEKGMLKLDAKYNAQPEPEAVSQTWEKSAAFFGVTGGEILAIAVGYHTTL